MSGDVAHFSRQVREDFTRRSDEVEVQGCAHANFAERVAESFDADSAEREVHHVHENLLAHETNHAEVRNGKLWILVALYGNAWIFSLPAGRNAVYFHALLEVLQERLGEIAEFDLVERSMLHELLEKNSGNLHIFEPYGNRVSQEAFPVFGKAVGEKNFCYASGGK
jgi:hypothetical protein